MAGDDSDENLDRTVPLNPSKLAEIKARAARIEAALEGEKAGSTVQLSLSAAQRAADQPAVPFDPNQPAQAPPPVPEPASQDDLGGTMVPRTRAPSRATPFDPAQAWATTPPVSTPPPVPPSAPRPPAPVPVPVARPPSTSAPWSQPDFQPRPPASTQREDTATAIDAPAVPAATKTPVETQAPEAPGVPMPERPERFNTPDRRKAARDLAALMTTEDADVERYMRRHVAGEHPLSREDVERLRDLLDAMRHALGSGDPDAARRITLAWEVLWRDGRKA